jgi:hypothetical protein
MSQNTYRDVGALPAINRSGVNGASATKVKTTDEKGRKLFVVGKTVVGGEEVVG